jgi:hypothetical protein
MCLEDLATRSGDPDEFVIDGYEGNFYTEHSDYSRRVDLRIDIERAIQHLAALGYAPDPPSPRNPVECLQPLSCCQSRQLT